MANKLKIEDDRMELATEFGYFELIKDKNDVLDLRVPVVETILVEKGELLKWLYTDEESGKVLKKSMKKLNKDTIFTRFLKLLSKEVTRIHGINYEGSLLKLHEDINIYNQMLNTKFNDYNQRDIQNFDFIKVICEFKCFFIKTYEKDFMVDLVSLYKHLHDSSLLSRITVIQNFLGIVVEKPLICKYTRASEVHARRYTLMKEKPRSNFELKMRGMGEPKEELKELISLNNYVSKEVVVEIAHAFVVFIEKKENTIINEMFINFARHENNTHYLTSGEKIKYRQLEAKEKFSSVNRRLSMPKGVSSRTEFKHKYYEKVSPNSVCFGEFCAYEIPNFFKNLKKNQKVEEINSKLVPKENKFSERGKNYELPNCLPVFVLKKAWDNRLYVDIVLKAYSIFPKNFDSNRFIESQQSGKQLLLYNPDPIKFKNLTEDMYYSKKNVCDKCFTIYNLIQSFLSNINESTFNCI